MLYCLAHRYCLLLQSSRLPCTQLLFFFGASRLLLRTLSVAKINLADAITVTNAAIIILLIGAALVIPTHIICLFALHVNTFPTRLPFKVHSVPNPEVVDA